MATYRRTAAAFATACALTALVLLPISPAGAKQVRAIVVGESLASGAYVPFQVNPNFDFWPGYSLSRVSNAQSYGLSGGLWPGFLVDAFAFLFGYQDQMRAMIGVAETQWPNEPNEAHAGFSDWGTLCEAGARARFPLPTTIFGDDAPAIGGVEDDGKGPTARLPEPVMTGCQEMWAEYGRFVPWKVASAASQSDELFSTGAADVAGFVSPGTTPVRIGDAHSTSGSDARGGKVVSASKVTMKEIAAGELLIGSLIAQARVVTDGTASGTRVRRSLRVADVTYQGQRAVIDEDGVHVEAQDQDVSQAISDPQGDEPLRSVNEELAAQGFVVRLFRGSTSVRAIEEDGEVVGQRAVADAGGLVIGMTRPAGVPEPFTGPAAESCEQMEDVDDTVFDDGEGDDGAVPRVTASTSPQPNPFFEDRPPYDQLPPTADVNQQVPPAAVCPFVLFNRAVDVGLVLGVAQAGSVYQGLPPLPPLPGSIPGTPDRVVYERLVSGDAPPPFGGLDGGDLGPSSPPPAARLLGIVESFGPDVASRVRLIYASLIAMTALLLVGRRAFRAWIRL